MLVGDSASTLARVAASSLASSPASWSPPALSPARLPCSLYIALPAYRLLGPCWTFGCSVTRPWSSRVASTLAKVSASSLASPPASWSPPALSPARLPCSPCVVLGQLSVPSFASLSATGPLLDFRLLGELALEPSRCFHLGQGRRQLSRQLACLVVVASSLASSPAPWSSPACRQLTCFIHCTLVAASSLASLWLLLPRRARVRALFEVPCVFALELTLSVLVDR